MGCRSKSRRGGWCLEVGLVKACPRTWCMVHLSCVLGLGFVSQRLLISGRSFRHGQESSSWMSCRFGIKASGLRSFLASVCVQGFVFKVSSSRGAIRTTEYLTGSYLCRLHLPICGWQTSLASARLNQGYVVGFHGLHQQPPHSRRGRCKVARPFALHNGTVPTSIWLPLRTLLRMRVLLPSPPKVRQLVRLLAEHAASS